MNPIDDIPILEFDPQRQAILEPAGGALDENAPSACVLCFFQEVLNDLKAEGRLEKVGRLVSEIGENPIYELSYEGRRLLVAHPGVGAPLAAGFLEELIAQGARRFIACGGCGVLDAGIAAGYALILTAAVRDEGTSYHYLPAGREVTASPRAVAALQKAFEKRGLPYHLAKTWTTDGLYRETAARRARRLAEGCSVVEMEAAAFFAVARFRGIEFGQVVYGGDLVVPEGWDKRGWNERLSERQFLFWLAVEACLTLAADSEIS